MAIAQTDAIIAGPVAFRQFNLGKACESHQQHEHNKDHVTFITNGSVKIIYEYEKDGETIKGETGIFSKDQYVTIKAGVRHNVKALEDNTTYLCIFSHVDFNGIVIETYIGNHEAYV